MYTTIKEIEDANRAIGKHWFDKATMKSFYTSFLPEVYASKYFIQSDKREEWLPRMYSICQCVDGIVTWASKPLEYSSADAAIKALHELLAKEESNAQ
jgi:hypothetical protein